MLCSQHCRACQREPATLNKANTRTSKLRDEKMTKHDHNEMKSQLIATAFALAVNAGVPAYEIKERTDALRKVIEEVAELKHEE